MPHKIRMDGSSWIFLAVLTLLLPVNWVISAVIAAAVHELCHIAALRILDIPVLGIRIGASGAILDTGTMTCPQELLCALAGPAGSLLLFLLLHVCPRIALCGLMQGLYNLLPIFPLDGGRAIKCGIRMLMGKRPCKRKKVGVQ